MSSEGYAMRSSLRALALLAISVLAATGTAPGQRAACTQSYMLVPVTGQTLAAPARIPCTGSANQPLKLGDLTPAHSRNPLPQCNRACQAGLVANTSDPQSAAVCDALAPAPLYENTMVLERVATSQCQTSQSLRQAPSIVAPVRAFNDNSLRQAPAVTSKAPAPAMREPMPMPAPMHNVPAVQHGSSRIPH